MSWAPVAYEESKATFLRIARTVEKAHSKAELRALLMADLEAPYHSFNPFDLVGKAENTAVELLNSILDDLDEEGIPK